MTSKYNIVSLIRKKRDKEFLSEDEIIYLVNAYSKNEIEESNVDSNNFLCTVDYVDFVNDSNAIVKFETTLGNTTNPFFGRYTYTKEGKDLLIGNELVNIYDFDQKENIATFVFEYGDNLGFFCAQIFESLPQHIHYTFDAEAELITTGKNVGKWKIKKRSNLREKTTDQ